MDMNNSILTARTGRHSVLRAGVALVAAALALSGCSSSDDPSGTAEKNTAASAYPLTIENCGRTITIDAPPQRAVSLNQGSTEILLSLGLADRMVGTATWTDPVRENLADENAKVPRLADNKPSFEVVLDTEPDFVSASFGGTLGPGDDETPSEAELRVAQAQLVGWLEGLFHGIQATLFAQQMTARNQLEEMRRRALPGRAVPDASGQYL